jgi:hypothetical protein
LLFLPECYALVYAPYGAFLIRLGLSGRISVFQGIKIRVLCAFFRANTRIRDAARVLVVNKIICKIERRCHEEEEELDMMAVLGFGGFDTTKGKEIADNTHGAVNKSKKRIYRQYMNRRGMVRRLLPGIHVFPIVLSCCVFDRWFQ